MNLQNMMDNLIKLTSNISKNNGVALFKKGLVNKIISKKIYDTYHIYGRVSGDESSKILSEKNKEFSTHIKFNLKDEVIGVKCTCSQYEENSKVIRYYTCSHIIATMYKFYYEVSNKSKNKIDKNQVVKKEEAKVVTDLRKNLNLNIKLKQVKVNNKNEYYLELRVGKEKTIAVEALGKFLVDPFNKFSDKDDLIIEFLKEKIKKESSRVVNGRSFRLYDYELKGFLDLIESKKEINLNYDYMNYNSQIHKEDIPLIFTIKKKVETIIVKPQKKSVIPIDSNKDIWIYDKKIYMPSEKQLKYYKGIYQKLREKDTLIYKSNDENLKKILYLLGEISKDIIIDESIKDEINKVNTPKFYIEKEGPYIICNLKIDYINNLHGIKDKRNVEKLEMALERYKFIKKDERFIFIGNEEDNYILLKEGLEFLNKIGRVILSKEFKNMSLIDYKSIVSNLREYDGRFYFEYKIEGLEYEEIPDALREMKMGSPFYKTKKDKLLDLNDRGMYEFLSTIEELNLFGDVYKEEIYVDKFNLLHLENKITNKKLPFISGEEKINTLLDKLINRDKEYIVPENLNAKLREYQKIGYSWLRTIEDLGFGGILADDMGLGKTIQTITLLLAKKGKRSIIITPTSVLYNWESEFEKFAPSLKVGIIHGSLKERSSILEDYKNYDVLLTTYGTLRRDVALYEDRNFYFCIIDEGQNIKNKASKISEAVKSIKADCKIALTGTPIENNLLELWSLFDFIMPMYLFSEEKFKDKFIRGNDEDLMELRDIISPFILRRLKEDVLKELPEKIEKEYIIPMASKQRRIYNSSMKEIKIKLRENKDNKILILSYLTKLRQLCLDPSLLIEDFKEESSKIKAVEEIANEALVANKKVIIFSQFTSALNKIGNKLKENNIEYLYLDGSIKAKERLSLAKEFNEGSTNVFLISLKAGGVGLNLTGANIVVHFDPWWNPAVEEQATDRAYRIGQKNVVEVIKLISKDSIEEKIIKLQEEKKELISKVIDGDILKGDKLNSITEEELLNLFS